MTRTIRRQRPRLETIRRRVERWRQTRRHARAPLPPRLWAAAVALVPEHGLYGTARALHLDYGALKRHVARRAAESRVIVSPQFVELPATPRVDHTVIEIDRPDEPTVRVRLNGWSLSALAEFARRVAGAAS
jgi:hypothetical protein